MQNHQLKNTNPEITTIEDNNFYNVLQDNENDCTNKDNKDKEELKEEKIVHHQKQRKSEINYSADSMPLEALEKVVKESHSV